MRPPITPLPGSYRLDPERSTVRANVKAMFGLVTVHGRFRVKDGEVVVAEDPVDSTVRAAIDAASFASGNSQRDRDVTSATLLDAATYPVITFTSQQILQRGEDWMMNGVVSAHGSTDTGEVRVVPARVEDGVVRFRATARLDRIRLGVTIKKGTVGRGVDRLLLRVFACCVHELVDCPAEAGVARPENPCRGSGLVPVHPVRRRRSSSRLSPRRAVRRFTYSGFHPKAAT
jgi:polyisoprenoid-binding protein YceI